MAFVGKESVRTVIVVEGTVIEQFSVLTKLGAKVRMDSTGILKRKSVSVVTLVV